MSQLPDFNASSSIGALQKVNYQGLPPADQTVDWDNTMIAPAFCDVANMTQTLSRFAIQVVLNTSDGYIVTNNWNAVWKTATPTAPFVHFVSTGIYTITLPTLVSDDYNASFGRYDLHAVNFTKAWANLENSGGLYACSCSASANVITCKLYDHTNALNSFSGFVLDLWGAW